MQDTNKPIPLDEMLVWSVARNVHDSFCATIWELKNIQGMTYKQVGLALDISSAKASRLAKRYERRSYYLNNHKIPREQEAEKREWDRMLVHYPLLPRAAAQLMAILGEPEPC